MSENDPRQPADALAELARIDLREHDLHTVLTRVAELAKRALQPRVAEVSLTLLRGDKATTAAFTGELALALDEAQYERGYGPCIEAGIGGDLLLIDDMRTEDRWPDYTPRAVELGALSSLSIALPVQDAVIGALNIYARTPGAFDEEAVAAVQTFGSYAAVAVANASLYESTATVARQMEEAMATRAVIEQAKGIIMGQRACSAEEAFAVLTKASQSANRKLREIAAELVEAASRRRR